MSLDHALDWLYAAPIAALLRENALLFPWVECMHVLSFTLVVGSISIVDLRLLGWASRERSVDQVCASVLPVTWIAFGLAVLTGSLLFASNAVEYAQNFYFRLKLALIFLAGINMIVFHLLVNPGANRRAAADRTALSDRIVGGFSIAVWVAVVACGRWIGYTMTGGG